MSSFIKGLSLDLLDFRAKVISVIEEHNSDASFCLSCFMWQALSSQDSGVCLLALHHSLRHYYHVGMRLGYNLSRSYGSRFLAIDAVDIQEAHAKEGQTLEFSPRIVFDLVRQKLNSIQTECKNVFIIIDDISDFLNLGVNVNDTIMFLRYIMTFKSNSTTLVICTHCHDEDEDQLKIKNTLLYSADIRLDIKCLETGFSKEVTGCIELTKSDDDTSEECSQPELYHYKTKERNINVFLPGNISFSY